MSSPKLSTLAYAAVAGGVSWVLFAILTVAYPGDNNGEDKVDLVSAIDHLQFGLFAWCLGLSVTAIAALHLHGRGADGRLGRIGAIVAGTGATAQCVVIAAIVVNGTETSWFGIAAPLAILTWFVGSVLLGIAVHRAGIMPGWVGIVLPFATAFAIVGSNAGTSAIIGVFQIVVGLRIARAAGAGTTLRAAEVTG